MLCLLMCQSSGSMSQKPLLQTYILFWHLSTFCFPGKPFLKCTLLFPLSRAHWSPLALVLLPFEITLLRPLGTSTLPNKMHVLQSLVYVTSLEHLALLNTHRFRNPYLCLALLYDVTFFWFSTLLSGSSFMGSFVVLASHFLGARLPRCYSHLYVLRVTFMHTHSFDITPVVMTVISTSPAHTSLAWVSGVSMYYNPPQTYHVQRPLHLPGLLSLSLCPNQITEKCPGLPFFLVSHLVGRQGM